jgi:hypothetical protein
MESRELCNKVGLKRTTWTPEEDEILLDTLEKKNNSDSWNSIAKKAGNDSNKLYILYVYT